MNVSLPPHACPPACQQCRLRKTGAFTAVKPEVLDFIEGFRTDSLAVEAGGEDAGGSGLFAWRFGSAGDEGILVRVDGTGGECERDGERAWVDVGGEEFSVAP